ncbi:MAG: ThuA domain-containing protein [Gemmataceae bacterium]
MDVNIIVEDKNHPATKHLGNSFSIADEIYQFRKPYDRKKLHILVRLDVESLPKKGGRGRRQDKDYAIAWTNKFGQGRIFYTALGHRESVWKDARFQRHIIGGLKYIFKIEQKDRK